MKDTNSNLSRRKFIKTSGALTAGSTAFTIIPASVLGKNGSTAANSRINLAFIGTGMVEYGQKAAEQMLKEPQALATAG